MKGKSVLLICLLILVEVGIARADVLKIFAGGGTAIPQIGDNATNINLTPFSVRRDLSGTVLIPSYTACGSGLAGLVRVDQFNKVDRITCGLPSTGDDIWIDFDGSVFWTNYYGAVEKINPDNTITRVAGTGIKSFSGDGGLAVEARLNLPEGVTTDYDGNIFISDYSNCNIRRVDRVTGIITTVAGDYYLGCGYNGNDNGATGSQLNRPMKLVFDSSWNLLIADTNNHCVRKVWENGNITTIAGICGTPGWSGDGGPAVSAQLQRPWGIDIDHWGNIYVGDSGNFVIRKIDSNGLISTIGSYFDIGQAAGISVDPDGHLYIADWNAKLIYRLAFSPKIESLNVNNGPPGTELIVGGKYFGTEKGSSYITLSGMTLQTTSWSNTEIHILIPTGVKTGDIVAHAEGGDSNGIRFRVTK